MKKNRKASALIYVMVSVGALGTVMATMLTSSVNEAKILARSVPRIQAQNAVEGLLQYAAGKVKYAFENTFDPVAYLEENPITVPSDLQTFFAGSDIGSLEINVVAEPAFEKVYIIPTSSNADETEHREKRVSAKKITIYAKAQSSTEDDIAIHGSLEFLINDTSFLEYAIIYNGDLEFFSATDMNINGPVHSNSNIFLASGDGADLTFNGPVTSSGDIFGGLKPLSNGSGRDRHWSDGHDDHVIFSDDFGNQGYVHDPDNDSFLTTEAIDEWHDWLADNPAMGGVGAPQFNPSGVPAYTADDPSTDGVNELTNDAYEIIMPPLDPDDPSYDVLTEANKFSVKSGLIIEISGDPDTEGETPTVEFAERDGITYYNADNPNYTEATFAVSAYKIEIDEDSGLPVTEKVTDPDGTEREVVKRTPVTLPDGIIGKPNRNLTAIEESGKIDPYDLFYMAEVQEGDEGYSELRELYTTYEDDSNNNEALYLESDGSLAVLDDEETYINNGNNVSEFPDRVFPKRRLIQELDGGDRYRYKDQQLKYQKYTTKYRSTVEKEYQVPTKKEYKRIKNYDVEITLTDDYGGTYVVRQTVTTLEDGMIVIKTNYEYKTIKYEDPAPGGDWVFNNFKNYTWKASATPLPDAKNVRDVTAGSPPAGEEDNWEAYDTWVDTWSGTPEQAETDPNLRVKVSGGSRVYGKGSWVTYDGWYIDDTESYVTGGIPDLRQGVQNDVFWIDVAALKNEIETPSEGWSGFDPSTDWNGNIYIQVPMKDPDDPSIRDSDKVRPAKYKDLAIGIFNAEELPSLPNPDDDPDVDGDEKIGFTLATNAPLYVVGNFNADGDLSTGSSTEPEDDEIPALVAADVVTFLSNDFVRTNDDYISHDYENEDGVNPFYDINIGSGDGADLEGIKNAAYDETGNLTVDQTVYENSFKWPGLKGNRAYEDQTAALINNAKDVISRRKVNTGNPLEFSGAVISGVPPSVIGDTDETSGGVHNFFRFLEDWEENSVDFVYRGAILGLFEPEIHPAKLPTDTDDGMAIYRAPNRNFGYNELFESATPPGTPTGRTFRTHTMTFMSEADYIAKTAGSGGDDGDDEG